MVDYAVIKEGQWIIGNQIMQIRMSVSWVMANTHPDVIDYCCSFALSSLGIADQVVPGTEDSPAERVVLTGSAR